MQTYLEGLFLQASLILALGAQNLFVLDCGIQKRHPLLVALICSLCDTLLILLGVLGATQLFKKVPIFQPILGVAGVLFLIYCGAVKMNEARRPIPVGVQTVKASHTFRSTVIAAFSFSLLNPHVYLDTVVLIGGYSSRFPATADRLLFGAGAASFSIIWFLSLGLGAAAISSQLNSPRVLRYISLVSGLILIFLGLKLARDTITTL